MASLCSRNLLNYRRILNISFISKIINESYYSTDNGAPDGQNREKLGGFAKAFMKQQDALNAPKPVVEDETFAALLRNSKFIDLGDPEGKVVTGKIFHTVNDDLYIDFGWKFHTVCTRPAKNGDDYVRGAIVRLRIRDLELSTRFLGNKTDLTLLEADCTILGLVNSPLRQQQRTQFTSQEATTT